MANFENVMLDLETMGNGKEAVICSIGAVEFDIETGETGMEFYERVSIQSCIDKGLKVDGSTILWWLTQSEEARAEIARDGMDIKEVLYRYST